MLSLKTELDERMVRWLTKKAERMDIKPKAPVYVVTDRREDVHVVTVCEYGHFYRQRVTTHPLMQGKQLFERTTFDFEELGEDTQEKVLEAERRRDRGWYDWWEYVYREWQDLTHPGTEHIHSISIDGFDLYRGEITAKVVVDLSDYLEATYNLAEWDGSVPWREWKQARLLRRLYKQGYLYNDCVTYKSNFYNSGHHDEVELSYSSDPVTKQLDEKFLKEVNDNMLDWARNVVRQIYRELEAEMEHLYSDECIKEEVMANDCYFDRRGNCV